MKRAALVLATSVALFISGAAYSASRVPVPIPSKSSTLTDGVSSGTNDVGHPSWTGPSFNQQHKTGRTIGGVDGRIGVTIKPRISVNPAKAAKAAIGAIKGGGAAGVLATAALGWAIDQIPGAEIVNSQPVMLVPGDAATGTPSGTDYKWCVSGTTNCAYNAKSACQLRYPSGTYVYSSKYGQSLPVGGYTIVARNDTTSDCKLQALGYSDFHTVTVDRSGSTCPAGGSYSDSLRSCTGEPQITPFNDSNFVDLEDVLRQVANSDWTRELVKKSCEGSLAPERCFDDLIDQMPIDGPAFQNGPARSQSTTTTNPDGTTSTTNVTVQNRYDYKYGDNYFDYKVTTTTTTTKDGQTTTETQTDETPEDQQPDLENPSDEQQEEMPAISDAYKPYIDKLNDIKTDVASPPSVVSPLGWSSWYSFGGGCSEIHAQLPVIGSWSTNYCPLINDWVRPVLAFIFVMFTWHYCRSLWSEAVTKARPM
jgi:hypothetical protein